MVSVRQSLLNIEVKKAELNKNNKKTFLPELE